MIKFPWIFMKFIVEFSAGFNKISPGIAGFIQKINPFHIESIWFIQSCEASPWLDYRFNVTLCAECSVVCTCLYYVVDVYFQPLIRLWHSWCTGSKYTSMWYVLYTTDLSHRPMSVVYRLGALEPWTKAWFTRRFKNQFRGRNMGYQMASRNDC